MRGYTKFASGTPLEIFFRERDFILDNSLDKKDFQEINYL